MLIALLVSIYIIVISYINISIYNDYNHIFTNAFKRLVSTLLFLTPIPPLLLIIRWIIYGDKEDE